MPVGASSGRERSAISAIAAGGRSDVSGQSTRLVRCLALTALLFAVTGAKAGTLPDMGPAPAFRLSTHDGAALSLADLHGKVVLVNFIYASCKDVCLTGTAKLARVQEALGEDFGRRVHFLSVTLDPAHDSGAVLEAHARKFGARLDGWAFLTGTPAAVRQVARDYGVAYRSIGKEVEHNSLASVIDAQGHLRVQYMGVQFDHDELLADLRGLLREGGGR